MHPFVHLNTHSEYSIVDSTIRIKGLVQSCVEKGMPAVALTDEMNLFAMVKFYTSARRAGVKPIIGAEVFIQEAGLMLGKVTLLAKNKGGFYNLSEIISKGWLLPKVEGKAAVPPATIFEYKENLIALVGGNGSFLQRQPASNLEDTVAVWRDEFKENLYLQIERVDVRGENDLNSLVIQQAQLLSIPVVATNAVRFLEETSTAFEAHQARIGINEGVDTTDESLKNRYSSCQFFRSVEQMNVLFADIPQALENTWKIAQQCNVELDMDKPQLPRAIEDPSVQEDEYFIKQAWQGMKQRGIDKQKQPKHAERLERELTTIVNMGFSGYFLIVADFIGWAKQQDIPVGPGRGSGAGSLVAYVLGITELDPLKYNLLFERFLNPERVSMPDFDVDMCMERRDEVIQYVAQKYGEERVSQIITFGTMSAKAVVRDSARVLAYPHVVGDRIAKSIPNVLGITLTQALKESDVLQNKYAREDETRSIIDLAKQLEGLVRNAGKHAGGVVIAPDKITRFSPLYRDESGGSITQFDKDDVESMGLVKFDFLGLRTLTIIHWAEQEIRKKNPDVDVKKIPLDDAKVFGLLKKADTVGVFQCESLGIRKWMKRMEPGAFEDIIALLALYRPGPLGSNMMDTFIQGKHGKQEINYLHPDLKEVLQETYGVFLYQEQVMQCAQRLADYSLGEADLLRRAMGKKKPEEMEKQQSIFVKRATQKGVDGALASRIFDLMAEFAEYGFNKSHSAAYALVTYQTAWLKVHFPAEFFVAVLNAEINNPDRFAPIILDAKKAGVVFLPVSVQDSKSLFSINEKNQPIWGLSAIKGLGSAAALMIEEAQTSKPFANLFEFCQRVPVKEIGRRGLEFLVFSGAMDCFGESRGVLTASLESAFNQAVNHFNDSIQGQGGLFDEQVSVQPNYTPASPTNPLEQLRLEKMRLGLYISQHPLQVFAQDLQQCKVQGVSALPDDLDSFGGRSDEHNGSSFWVAAEILQKRERRTRRGGVYASVRCGDGRGFREIEFYDEVLQENAGLLNTGALVIMSCSCRYNTRQYEWRRYAEEVLSIKQFRERFFKRVIVKLKQGEQNTQQVNFLSGICQHQGVPLTVEYQSDRATARFNSSRHIPGDDESWVKLRGHFGDNLSIDVN